MMKVLVFCRALPLLCKDRIRVNNFLLYNNRSFCVSESNTNSLVLLFAAEILYQAKCKKKKKSVYKPPFKSTQVMFLSREASIWDNFWRYSTGFYSQVLFSTVINIALRAFVTIMMIDFYSNLKLRNR